MIRSILIGLDGSEHSTAAAELGVRWGRKFGSLLVGLGVVDEPTIHGPETLFQEDTLATARHRVEEFLGRFASRCVDAAVRHKLLECEGDPDEKLLAEAQRYDLILLGVETHFRFATQIGPDHTLARVLKNSPRPVVAVPNALSSDGPVVVAYDGSVQAARTLQAFQASGLGRDVGIHVVSVGVDQDESHRHAERAVEFLGFHQMKATPHVIFADREIGETILRQADRLGAGLLVMGCFGHSALREFFLGSVTRTALNKSAIPLFLSS